MKLDRSTPLASGSCVSNNPPLMSIFHPVKGKLNIDYRITQEFGERPDVYKQFGLAGHNGIDYAGKNHGDKIPCYSVVDGVVTKVRRSDRGYGNEVRILSAPKDGKQKECVYAHLDSFAEGIVEGARVKEKQMIGIIGNTGFSSGVHLHWGVRFLVNGAVQDFNNGYMGWQNVTDWKSNGWILEWDDEPSPEESVIPVWAEKCVDRMKKQGIKTSPTRTVGSLPVYHLLMLVEKYLRD